MYALVTSLARFTDTTFSQLASAFQSTNSTLSESYIIDGFSTFQPNRKFNIDDENKNIVCPIMFLADCGG